MSDSSQDDFSSWSDAELTTVANMYANSFSDDYVVQSSGLVNLFYKYIEVVLYRSRDNSKHVDFVTVNNGKIFTFTMECHSSDFDGFEKQLREILKTFRAD